MKIQWLSNGDHPGDMVGMSDFEKQNNFEGKVVRYFRSPDLKGHDYCPECGEMYDFHGFIDQGDGIKVCPGNWVVTTELGKCYVLKE